MKLLPLAAAALLVAGCASLSGAERSWLGTPYSEVISEWGPPTRRESLPQEGEALTWVSEGREARPGLQPQVGIFAGTTVGGGAVGVGAGSGVAIGPGPDVPVKCERTLVFRQGIVVESNWIGPVSFCSRYIYREAGQ